MENTILPQQTRVSNRKVGVGAAKKSSLFTSTNPALIISINYPGRLTGYHEVLWSLFLVDTEDASEPDQFTMEEDTRRQVLVFL